MTMKGRHHYTTGRRDHAFLQIRQIINSGVALFFSFVALGLERCCYFRYFASDDGINRLRELLS